MSAISGEDAFTLAATYGFPIELTVELAEERGQQVDVDVLPSADGRAQGVSRGAAGRHVRAEDRRARDGLRRLREDRGADGDRGARGGRARAASARSSSSRRSIPRAAARCRTSASSSTRRRAHAPSSSRRARRRRPDPPVRGRGVRRRRPCARRRALVAPLPDDGEPHGDAPPPSGASRRARRARGAGGLGRAPRQASLRLHAHAGALARRAGRDREAREREGVREPPGAHVHRPHRRGAKARRDDALHGEVRRGRPRRRDPRLLDRALRRDARADDGGDRPVRDPLGELRRIGRTAHRGGDVR